MLHQLISQLVDYFQKATDEIKLQNQIITNILKDLDHLEPVQIKTKYKTILTFEIFDKKYIFEQLIHEIEEEFDQMKTKLDLSFETILSLSTNLCETMIDGLDQLKQEQIKQQKKLKIQSKNQIVKNESEQKKKGFFSFIKLIPRQEIITKQKNLNCSNCRNQQFQQSLVETQESFMNIF